MATDEQSAEFDRQMLELMSRWMKRALSAAETSSDTTGLPGIIQPQQAARPVADVSANLEEFSGKGNLTADEWIRRFELAREIGQWTEAQIKSVLLVKMVGAARLWHLNHGAKEATYDTWKDKFVAAFSRKQQMGALLDQLQSCVQGKSEPLDEYAFRKEAIALQLNMGQADVKDQILRGLRSEYRFLVHEVSGRTHADTSALVQDIERTMCLERHLRQQSGSVSYRAGSDNLAKANSVVCFACSQVGHRRSQCPQANGRNEYIGSRALGSQGSSTRQPLLYTQHGAGPSHAAVAPVPVESAAAAAPVASGDTATPRTASGQRESGQLTCFRCRQPGHTARLCTQPPKVRRVESEHVSSSGVNSRDNNNTVECADIETKSSKVVVVNATEWTAKVDTEAEITVASKGVADKVGLVLEPSTVSRVKGVGGSSVPLGQCVVALQVDGLVHENVVLTILPDEALDGEAILLGKNLLDREEIVTVYRRGEAQVLSAEEHPEIVNLFPHENPKVVLVARDNTELSPHSVGFVEVETQTETTGAILLESDPCGVLCEVTEGRTTVPVMNPGSCKVVVTKGSVVKRGQLVPDDDIFMVKERRNDNVIASVCQATTRSITAEQVNMGAGVPLEVQTELCALLNRYQNVFADSMSSLGRTPLAEFDIEELPGSRPVTSKPYRLSLCERESLREIIKEMSDAGMVRPSQSPYASPVLLVKKKDGTYRMVIDYRRLNAQTLRGNFPMPLIDDIIDAVGGRELYSTFDLAWGYFQIPVTARTAEKAAFVTPDGHYEPNVMMMGLSGAPAKFQEMMVRLTDSIGQGIAVPFLDDLITSADSYSDQLTNIEKVLQALSDAGLTVRLEKCCFFMKTVEFLGFRLSKGGVQPGSKKLKAVAEYPRPTNATEVRRFLGLTSFFRRFVKGYACIAAPLSGLLRKSAEFVWTSKCENAFEGLKSALLSEPVLVTFKQGRPIEVHTDASAVGLGALLLQEEGGNWHLVYAISRKLSLSESHYHSTRLEQLAVVWALQRLRHYLHGQAFTVVSDCRAVTALKSSPPSPQVARWLDQLAEFNFTVRHRPGTAMEHVDALSRGPVEEAQGDSDSNGREVAVQKVSVETQVAMVQAGDPWVTKIADILRKERKDRTTAEQGISQEFVLVDGVLYRETVDYNDSGATKKRQFVVPASMRKYVCVCCHDEAGHFGNEKTLAVIAQRYWFPRMRAYVKQHIRACVECIFNKDFTGRREGLCNPIVPERRPFQKLFIDHLGPLPKSMGKEHIVVVVDGLSKFVLLEAVRSTSTTYVLRFLERIVLRYGAPDVIVTDRGTAFTSKHFQEFMRKFGIKHALISTQHPQSNGQVERVNKEVARGLRTICAATDKSDWASKLARVESHMNRAPHKSTGKTPFEVLHGYLPRYDNFSTIIDAQQEKVWQPASEIQQQIRSAIESAQTSYKAQYDKKRKPHTIRYDVGDVVVVKRLPVPTGAPTKLQAKFRGPMVVTEVLPNDTYRLVELIDRSGYTVTAHCSQLRLYKVAHEQGDDIENVSSDEAEEDTLVEDGDQTIVAAQDQPTADADGEQAATAAAGREQTTEDAESEASETSDERPMPAETTLRRSTRTKRPPIRFTDFSK